MGVPVITQSETERAAVLRRYEELLEHSDDKVEIIDGRIVVSPVASIDHANVGYFLFRMLLDIADLKGWHLWHDVALFLGLYRDRYRPDLIVAAPGARRWDRNHVHGDAVELVAEVVSPTPEGTKRDHEIKPRDCALGGVPLYLVVDPEQEVARLLCDPGPSGYRREVKASIGEPLELPAPFGITLDTARLLGA